MLAEARTKAPHGGGGEFITEMTEGYDTIIAHHPATILKADVIFVVKDMAMTERGTHDELIAAGGFLPSCTRFSSATRRSSKPPARSRDGLTRLRAFDAFADHARQIIGVHGSDEMTIECALH